MRPEVHILHFTPSRIRLKVPCRERAPEVLQKLYHLFKEMEGISTTKLNPITRTLLLTHKNCSSEIMELLNGLEVDINKKSSKDAHIQPEERLPLMRKRLKKRLGELDEKIKDFTGGEVDLDMMMGLSMFGMSYFQTFRNNRFLPPGEELMATGLKLLLKGKIWLDD
jgi:hypothetical protein